MSSLLGIGWLIPLMPFLGALLIGLFLLISNRTINRLTGPVSFLLIFCVGISTALSFFLFVKHLSGKVLQINTSFGFYLDTASELVLTIIGVIGLISMTSAYYFRPRKKGYVLYFALLGSVIGFLFTFVISGKPFHSIFDPILSPLLDMALLPVSI